MYLHPVYVATCAATGVVLADIAFGEEVHSWRRGAAKQGWP